MPTDLLSGQMPPAPLQLLGSAKLDKQIIMKNSGTKLQAPRRYTLRNIHTKTQRSTLCTPHLVYTLPCVHSTLCTLHPMYTPPCVYSTLCTLHLCTLHPVYTPPCVHSTLYTRHAHGEDIHTSAHTVTILMRTTNPERPTQSNLPGATTYSDQPTATTNPQRTDPQRPTHSDPQQPTQSDQPKGTNPEQPS